MKTLLILAVLALCGCEGGGYYGGTYVPQSVSGGYYPAYVPNFYQPTAPVFQPLNIPTVYPGAQIDTRAYQRFNGSSAGQIRY